MLTDVFIDSDFGEHKPRKRKQSDIYRHLANHGTDRDVYDNFAARIARNHPEKILLVGDTFCDHSVCIFAAHRVVRNLGRQPKTSGTVASTLV